MSEEQAIDKANNYQTMIGNNYYFQPNNILAKVIKVQPCECEPNNFEVLVTGKNDIGSYFCNIENQGLVVVK